MSDLFSIPKRSLDVAGLSVMLAIPTHRDLSPYTVNSLLETQAECIRRGIPLTIEGLVGSSLVHHCRSKLGWTFLQSKHDRLFWVDSDMVWKAADFVRLLAFSTVMDVVGAAYTAKQDPPLFFVKTDDLTAMQTNEWGCIAMDGCGLGFTCMSRGAVEAVAEKSPRKRFHQIPEGPIPLTFRFVNDEVDDGEEAIGEDMAFFREAKALGYQLWVDPTIELGHVGPKVFKARFSDHIQKVETEVSTAA